MKEEKQYEVLRRASLFLQKNNCEEKVAEILLCHHLNVTKTQFIMNMQCPVPSSIIDKFERDLRIHVKEGIPIQHLLGYEIFYGRKFIVNKHTLIPRPETEELVYKTLKLLEKNRQTKKQTIVDVGTGSGIIGITLALEVPELEVYATDISKEALHVAKENAKKHGANVTFLHGDFLQPLIERKKKVDYIVSNPPYIAYKERKNLSKTVVDYDPEIALFAKRDGLAAYETILFQATEIISLGGVLLFEIGHEQGKAVKNLIQKQFPKSKVEVIKDINQLDRIILAYL